MANIPAGGRPAAPPASVQRSYLCWLAATALYVIASVVSVALTFGSAGQAAAQDTSGVTGSVITATLVVLGIIMLVLAVLTVLFAQKMRAGRSWARITLTVFGVIFALANLGGAFRGGSQNFTINNQVVDNGAGSTVGTIGSIVVLLLLIAALVLQWLPDGRGYFASAARPPAPPQASPPATP